MPDSSRPVEGTVNRIKMINRQMYGRAKFDMLRKRILSYYLTPNDPPRPARITDIEPDPKT